MISLRVFVTTLALAVKVDNVRAADTRTSPFSFHYNPSYIHNDTILVNVILKNVPEKANHYALFYQTENCDRKTTGQHTAGCDVPARNFNDIIPTNRTITVMQKLNRGSIRIYIELRQDNKYCATKQIMDGIRDTNANENKFHQDCIINKLAVCDVIVDFGNQCAEPPPAKLDCTLHSEHLTCRADTDVVIPEDTVHQWYQGYKDGSLVGIIPQLKRKKTEFKMKIYKFDSNTFIYSVMSSTRWEKDLRTEKYKILPTNTYEKNDNNMKTKKYTDKVVFNCTNRAHTHVGWIEPTGNKIKTYNKTSVSLPFRKEQNNSMFCCVNYHNYTVIDTTVVERNVNDITVLIYEEPVNQDNKDRSSKIYFPGNTDRASKSTTTSWSPDQNMPAVTPDPWTRPPSASPSDSAEQHSTYSAPDNTKYYIGTAVVAGIILLASLAYVVVKKYWRKASDPTAEEALQLDTYATANTVLYAELDIRPSTGQPSVPAPDATYAEIIGVLRPQNGHVKK